MTRAAIISIALAVMPASLFASPPATSTDGAIISSTAEVQAQLKPTDKDVFVGAIPAGPGANAVIVRRTGDGVVEVHDALSDILVAQKGKATLVVGGTVRNAKQTAPGEWRGGTLEGGRRLVVLPGATAWIPAGVPHQLLIPRGGSFTYLAFKFAAAK